MKVNRAARVLLAVIVLWATVAAAGLAENTGPAGQTDNNNSNSTSADAGSQPSADADQGQLANISLGDVIEGGGKAVTTMEKLWGKQRLMDLLNGKLVIPDEVTNEYITEVIKAGNAGNSIESVSVTTRTGKKLGFRVVSKNATVLIKADIREIAFDAAQKKGYMKFFVTNVALDDPTIFGWVKNLFVRCYSFGTLCNMFGSDMNYGKNVKVITDGDNVAVDFIDAVMKSPVADVDIYGVKLVNQIKITGFDTDDGNLYLYVDFGFSDALKKFLLKLAQ
ncbi:MAG: hypothetical protein N3A57_06560 [Negativicutes bacterium]|nr:hypothetical protein [Negativicutes bacterium]